MHLIPRIEREYHFNVPAEEVREKLLSITQISTVYKMDAPYKGEFRGNQFKIFEKNWRTKLGPEIMSNWTLIKGMITDDENGTIISIEYKPYGYFFYFPFIFLGLSLLISITQFIIAPITTGMMFFIPIYLLMRLLFFMHLSSTKKSLEEVFSQLNS